MEKELDADIIKATQTSLGKYVKRPPLSEKLLRKPPFRFLHDIVTSVLKTTGFFNGLFEPEELLSDNVKDRDSKILFLNKVISVVGFAAGKPLTIKPSKIVAGQEAEKTNELLQSLASALDKKISSDEAVKKYKENGSIQQVSDKKLNESTKSVKEKDRKVESKKNISKSSEKLIINKKDSGRSSVKNSNDGKTKDNQKEITTKNVSPPRKIAQQTKSTIKGVKEKKQIDTKETQKLEDIDKNKKVQNNLESSVTSLNDEIVNIKGLDRDEQPLRNDELLATFDNQQPLEVFSSDNQLNSSLSSQDLTEVEGNKSVESHIDIRKDSIPAFEQKTDEINLTSNNILTNSIDGEQNINNDNVKQVKNSEDDKRLDQDYSIGDTKSNNIKNNGVGHVEAVPKSPVKNNSANTRPKSVRPSSSRPGAPRLRDKHDNTLNESENLIVGKVNIITENAPLEEEEDSSMVIIEQEKKPSSAHDEQEQFELSSKPHGHLVQQILDSQKEFSQVAGKTEIEWEFGAQKARDAVNKEIEQLRYNIQGLSRVANPLGKILDHIQEDVEVMRQELQQWIKTYDVASKELLKQKTLNEDSLFPLRTKLKQLEVDINEKHEKINDLKVVIHKNSSRIEKLLISGNVQ